MGLELSHAKKNERIVEPTGVPADCNPDDPAMGKTLVADASDQKIFSDLLCKLNAEPVSEEKMRSFEERLAKLKEKLRKPKEVNCGKVEQ